jgi:hypothetical protein
LEKIVEQPDQFGAARRLGRTGRLQSVDHAIDALIEGRESDPEPL